MTFPLLLVWFLKTSKKTIMIICPLLAMCFAYITRPMVWLHKKQKVVSLSTTKVDYCGIVNVDTKVVWIR